MITRKHKFIPLVLLAMAWIFTGCGDGISGNENENLPPETSSVVKTINRVGAQRFVSQIEIKWWGDDPDGFVSGYEFSTDKGQTWSFTQRQDSTFLVELPEGADTFDFEFQVRAVDNFKLIDPSPAVIVFPVKNSAPQISFDIPIGTSTNPGRWPKKTFPIMQYKWVVNDPDGFENLDYVEFFVNDTTAEGIIISKDYSSLIIEAENPEATESTCKILLGSTLQELSDKAEGLKLNNYNVFYLRATDKVGAKSDFARTDSIFVKQKVSNALLVNAYNSQIEVRENFFTENLLAAGISNFDTIRVNEVEGEYYTQLAADNVTQTKIFALFDVLIWFGEDAAYTLTLAQRTTGDFIDQGGKMFSSVFFSAGIDPLSTYLEFTPIDSLVDPGGSVFFMDKKAQSIPVNTDWPTLVAPRIITSTRPFYPGFGVLPLYNAQLKTPAGDWTGPATIMAKKEVNGQTQFIISSLELYRLSGGDNMPELFTKIFKDELGLN